MSEQYSIDLQRRKLELVGTLWLNNTRGHISWALTLSKLPPREKSLPCCTPASSMKKVSSM